jgi:hypothetical protein
MITVRYHNAYVLWLIRQGIATTWLELCAHFEIDRKVNPTEQNVLFSILMELWNAHLIQGAGEIEELTPNISPEDFNNMRLSVTPLSGRVLHALRLSLSDLARSAPNQRLIVTPVLQRTFGTKYQSDILVFMPFAGELGPVYEDHLKSVAQKLGKSIARADDFFTSDQIVNEIWTALVTSKLVIADCTQRNSNVFYELGLAHAVGKPTILITQNSDDIPFDLRHRRYLRYELTPRGMKHFEESLEKTITTILAEESSAVK